MKRNILGLILALVVSGCAGSSGTPVPPEEEASSKSADPAPEKPGIDLAVDPKVEPVPEAKPVPVPIAVEGASVSKPTESVETAVTTTTTITATAQKSAGAPKANPVVEKEAIPQEEKPASKPEPEPEPEPKSQKMKGTWQEQSWLQQEKSSIMGWLDRLLIPTAYAAATEFHAGIRSIVLMDIITPEAIGSYLQTPAMQKILTDNNIQISEEMLDLLPALEPTLVLGPDALFLLEPEQKDSQQWASLTVGVPELDFTQQPPAPVTRSLGAYAHLLYSKVSHEFYIAELQANSTTMEFVKVTGVIEGAVQKMLAQFSAIPPSLSLYKAVKDAMSADLIKVKKLSEGGVAGTQADLFDTALSDHSERVDLVAVVGGVNALDGPVKRSAFTCDQAKFMFRTTHGGNPDKLGHAVTLGFINNPQCKNAFPTAVDFLPSGDLVIAYNMRTNDGGQFLKVEQLANHQEKTDEEYRYGFTDRTELFSYEAIQGDASKAGGKLGQGNEALMEEGYARFVADKDVGGYVVAYLPEGLPHLTPIKVTKTVTELKNEAIEQLSLTLMEPSMSSTEALELAKNQAEAQGLWDTNKKVCEHFGYTAGDSANDCWMQKSHVMPGFKVYRIGGTIDHDKNGTVDSVELVDTVHVYIPTETIFGGSGQHFPIQVVYDPQDDALIVAYPTKPPPCGNVPLAGNGAPVVIRRYLDTAEMTAPKFEADPAVRLVPQGSIAYGYSNFRVAAKGNEIVLGGRFKTLSQEPKGVDQCDYSNVQAGERILTFIFE